MSMDSRTMKKLQGNTGYRTVIDPVTGEVKTRKARARSFKRFNRDVEEVLKGAMSYESCFDLMSVIAELDVELTCTIGPTNVRSYMIKTMDGRFAMGSISLVRTMLTFVQKTVPIPGVYTERQIKRIKAIVRMNTELKRIHDEWNQQQRKIAGYIEDEPEEVERINVEDDEVE